MATCCWQQKNKDQLLNPPFKKMEPLFCQRIGWTVQLDSSVQIEIDPIDILYLNLPGVY